MDFVKMHGLGNDFVFVKVGDYKRSEGLASHAKAICDRNFGVGADGLIMLMPSDVADVRMRIINSDGSEARMCGNALRCAAMLYAEDNPSLTGPVSVETLKGVQLAWIEEKGDGPWRVRVDMGEPILRASDIPVISDEEQVMEEVFDVGGSPVILTCVSMGNPHAVTFVEVLDRQQMLAMGPQIELHPRFPDRTNVEFVVADEEGLHVLVWERGAGPTLACGSGACAVLVAAALTGRSGPRAKVFLPGGHLEIEWENTGHVLMTGPAEKVFSGSLFRSL